MIAVQLTLLLMLAAPPPERPEPAHTLSIWNGPNLTVVEYDAKGQMTSTQDYPAPPPGGRRVRGADIGDAAYAPPAYMFQFIDRWASHQAFPLHTDQR